MFLTIILILTSLIFWIVSVVFNDIEDGLQYYYKESIFDWLPKDGWWAWYMRPPEVTWKRKYVFDDNENIIGRKLWPSFIYDGWHAAKFIRQTFQYLVWFLGILTGLVLIPLSFAEMFLFFTITIILFAVTNHLTHEKYIFKGIIKKSWWIERGKEEKIKKILDKYF